MKPCPFCGSNMVELVRFCGTNWNHAVRCGKCGAEGPTVYEVQHPSVASAEDMAVAEWDTRQ